MNESCPPDQVGVDGHQVDIPTAGSDVFLQMHNLGSLASLCEYGLSPGLVPGIIMRVLSAHFANPALIMTENLKKYVWSPDQSLSKIRITLSTRFDPKLSGMLPALIVKRGNINSERKFIGDRNELTDAREVDAGVQTYCRYNSGSARIFVMSETDGEAEDLSCEVFDALSFLAPLMIEKLPFHDFQVRGLGELGVMEGLGNKIGVPIDLEFVYEYAWAIKPIAPKLKTLKVHIP